MDNTIEYIVAFIIVNAFAVLKTKGFSNYGARHLIIVLVLINLSLILGIALLSLGIINNFTNFWEVMAAITVIPFLIVTLYFSKKDK